MVTLDVKHPIRQLEPCTHIAGPVVYPKGTALFKSSYVMAYAYDIHILGRTTQHAQTDVIQIEQVAVGARS